MESYRSINFEQRIKAFSVFSKDTIKITAAKRGNGIGTKLAAGHVKWMKEKGCKVIGVTVSQENGSTINFYRRLGFYPNTLYMQQRGIIEL